VWSRQLNLAHVARNKKVLKSKLKQTNATAHLVRNRLRSVKAVQNEPERRTMEGTLDSALTMDHLVTEVVRSCNCHIQALRYIRPLVTFDAATLVGHSVVLSRLDYANTLLYGASAANIHRLHSTGCAELTGKSNLPSSTASHCNRIMPAASPASSSPTHQLQTSSHRHLPDHNNLYSNLLVSLDPLL